MQSYLMVGVIVGIVLWVTKYVLACVVLPRSFNKWLHRTPVGLLAMDTIFGIIAVKTITMAGASGLVTLITLVTYGACTGILVLKYLIVKKTKDIWSKI